VGYPGILMFVLVYTSKWKSSESKMLLKVVIPILK